MCKTLLIGCAVAAALVALVGVTPVPATAATPLSIYDARQIGFNMGIVQIKKVELDDGVWEIKGWDKAGHKIEIKADADSGKIVKVERH
jgi:Peptidase propeptide and YPEB domain